MGWNYKVKIPLKNKDETKTFFEHLKKNMEYTMIERRGGSY